MDTVLSQFTWGGRPLKGGFIFRLHLRNTCRLESRAVQLGRQNPPSVTVKIPFCSFIKTRIGKMWSQLEPLFLLQLLSSDWTDNQDTLLQQWELFKILPQSHFQGSIPQVRREAKCSVAWPSSGLPWMPGNPAGNLSFSDMRALTIQFTTC